MQVGPDDIPAEHITDEPHDLPNLIHRTSLSRRPGRPHRIIRSGGPTGRGGAQTGTQPPRADAGPAAGPTALARREADADALVRAVEELHAARVLWLARAEEYAAQRRAEKRAGRRAVPDPRPWWPRSRWEGPDRAWSDDPFHHPPLRLPAYVRRSPPAGPRPGRPDTTRRTPAPGRTPPRRDLGHVTVDTHAPKPCLARGRRRSGRPPPKEVL
ncbi:hypothetical protein GCM10010360_66560 [Streptomyces nogalater]